MGRHGGLSGVRVAGAVVVSAACVAALWPWWRGGGVPVDSPVALSGAASPSSVPSGVPVASPVAAKTAAASSPTATPKPAVAPKPAVNPMPKPAPKPATPPPAAPLPVIKPLPVPAATVTEQVIAYAAAQIGKPYVWGATGPLAFDCSGLMQTAFENVGVHLPRTSGEQSLVGAYVPLADLLPGDIVFWGAPGEATHDALYIGDERYIAAENPREGVILARFSFSRPQYGRRVY